MSLRLAFMGTPDFATPALAALVAAGHDIAAVYSRPPRPAGRGQKPRPSPVHAWADSRGLAVRAPASLKDEGARRDFAALALDAAVVVAYGLILPKPILDAPRLGCFNIHASLLPRWRGAAPIQRAVLAGDAATGITIMRMDEGLDTGGVVLQESVPIGPATTAAQLHDSLAALGARLIVAALAGIAEGRLAARPQPALGVTYAAKLTRDEARLDWRRPAAELARRVRAFDPWPGAWFEKDGERIKVLAAECVSGRGAPGAVIDDDPSVACGDGALRLVRLQRPGKAALGGAEFLRGYRLAVGDILG